MNILLQTAILSDSLFRPVLQGLTSVPEDWFVNCTPGATFADIEREINGVGIPPGIENVFVVCGTNYQNRTLTIAKDQRRLYGTIHRNSSRDVKVRCWIYIYIEYIYYTSLQIISRSPSEFFLLFYENHQDSKSVRN